MEARVKTFDDDFGVLGLISANHYDRFDSYIIWRWKDENDPSNKRFEFGIVHRSLNNLQSMDWKTSMLPSNELNCKNYVHTNASTTIAWDVQEYCTTLVWTFNPTYDIHEKYFIDPDTRELHTSKTKMSWNDVDVYTDNFKTKIDLIDSNGKLLWNIASNVMDVSDYTREQTPIYQQPKYQMILAKGTSIDRIPDKSQPIGNWQLVFPRTQTFHFRNSNGYEYTAKNIHKLNVIKNVETQERTDVFDINDNPVNDKTLIINTNENNTASIKVYNQSTGKWNDI
jgi:hypothetical protein